MKRMNQIYVLSFSLLLSGAACAADMGTPTPGLPSREDHATQSWTAEELVLGQELIGSAKVGNIEKVKEILTRNPSLVNFKGRSGETALFSAIGKGYTEIVDRLLSTGADLNLNIQTNNGWTALMEASFRGHTEIVNKLIEASVEVNTQKNDGATALILAAHEGHTEIVERLLAIGAQVNTQDNDGWSALMIAAFWGHTETVQALLAARALSTLTRNDGKTALELAQERGCVAIVELLQNHVDIEPEEETLMVKPALSELME